MDTSDIIHSHIINKLERKISLMETKFVQEISKLENRIKKLGWEMNDIKKTYFEKSPFSPGH